MDGSGAHQSKTRQQIETELLDELRQTQAEWCSAAENDRDAARQRFMDALQRFNGVILHKKPPESFRL